MNILAEKQKSIYEKNISATEYNERNREFLDVYYNVRLKHEKRFENWLSLEQRKKLHGFVLFAYKIQNRCKGLTYEVIGDEHFQTDRPIIFAVSHIGKFDIQLVSEAIKMPYYLLSGDYEHIQGTIDAFFLSLNGVIYFNEKVKEDRRLASKKMIAHLRNGGNLMYFRRNMEFVT